MTKRSSPAPPAPTTPKNVTFQESSLSKKNLQVMLFTSSGTAMIINTTRRSPAPRPQENPRNLDYHENALAESTTALAAHKTESPKSRTLPDAESELAKVA